MHQTKDLDVSKRLHARFLCTRADTDTMANQAEETLDCLFTGYKACTRHERQSSLQLYMRYSDTVERSRLLQCFNLMYKHTHSILSERRNQTGAERPTVSKHTDCTLCAVGSSSAPLPPPRKALRVQQARPLMCQTRDEKCRFKSQVA